MNTLHTTKSMRACVALLPILFFALALQAWGQSQTQGRKKEELFSFGPPLRNDIVFAYKYTERVTQVYTMEGNVLDSNHRVINYYITQRQIPSKEKKGVWVIEVNVDSMELDFRGMEGRVYFHTQHLDGKEWELVKHREVFGPSVLVNRPMSITITPYGQILSVGGRSLKSAREQAADPAVDQFTRDRLSEVLSDEYIASVLLPWRGVVPLGQKVGYEKNLKIPFWTSFDRISFRDTAAARLVKGPDSALHLAFTANLDRPINKTFTIAGFDEAIPLGSATATVNGDLKLDEDGVVNSGWTMMKGTIVGNRGGVPVNGAITHEIYIEAMGMMPFASN